MVILALERLKIFLKKYLKYLCKYVVKKTMDPYSFCEVDSELPKVLLTLKSVFTQKSAL